MGLKYYLIRKIRALSRRHKKYTLSDLLTLYTYIKNMESLSYYDPEKDDRCRKKLYFPNMLACIATVSKIIRDNPITSENNDIDVFKGNIVTETERELIRQMCLEFIHSEHRIAEHISRMARSEKPEFKAKAESAIASFKRLQKFVLITLQKSNLE